MKKHPNTPSDKQLDTLLQGWSEKQQPSSAELARLCDRVQEGLRNQPVVVAATPGWEGQRALRSRKLLVTLGAVAASVVLGFVLWNRRPEHAEPAFADAGSKASPAESSVTFESMAADFSNQVELIGKLEAAYQQPVAWFAESSQDLEVELEENVSGSNQTNQPQTWLLIRLALEPQPDPLVNRQPASAGPVHTPVWQVDMAVRDQQTAQLSSQDSAGEQIVVWPCLTQDGLVMVDTKFRLDGTQHTAGNQSHLMRPGSRTRLATVNGKYDLWQYVQVVNRTGQPEADGAL